MGVWPARRPPRRLALRDKLAREGRNDSRGVGKKGARRVGVGGVGVLACGFFMLAWAAESKRQPMPLQPKTANWREHPNSKAH